MEPRLIDIPGFCRRGETVEGSTPVSELERLSSACASPDGAVEWRVSGFMNEEGIPCLKLHAASKLMLVCQRCLEPFEFGLDSETLLIAALSEEEADRIESQLEDTDPAEVFVSDGKTDVLVLLEDEALLSLPLSPRHEVCPENSATVRKEERESPFSVLKSLKAKAKP